MQITEVRIKLMKENGDERNRLRAFCSIAFDNCFAIQDLKIIEGNRGLLIAMPSRKLTDRCPNCDTKNHLRARYCNQCGITLNAEVVRQAFGDAAFAEALHNPAKLYADIAHPINSQFREVIQEAVILAYRDELEHSVNPKYVPVIGTSP